MNLQKKIILYDYIARYIMSTSESKVYMYTVAKSENYVYE